ncbi:hypothetical protein E5347_09010 [Clostridium sartagoforme]|uniref:O-antigen ligase domain-containing protein n=1 Tax=Clostridium sartagoforme TaxID=84031 RepID=A0A4S2DJH9_9CLOT|nr:hypothetical protein [Clostridium sartagoforme]TGY42349.1 hypothetical protein E5347_09010 [Clostridium sartagoforme]
MNSYLGYIILGIFCILIFIRYINNKEITSITISYCIISPSVQFIGMKLDSSYFLLVYICMLVILFKKDLRVNKNIKSYFLLTIFICFIYYIAWMFNSGKDVLVMLISLAGILKVGVFMVILYSLDCEKLQNNNYIFIKIISIVTILNLLAILYQVFFPSEAYNIFSELYSSNTANYYKQDTSLWGKGGFYNGRYTRYFGLFENPMSLACYSLIAISYVITKISSRLINKKLCTILLIILLYIGFMSTTKTFILGIVLLFIFLAVLQMADKSNKKIKLLTITLIMLAFILTIVFYSEIYNLLFEYNPSLAYYFSYLKDPVSAFNTRFGSLNGDGSLSYVFKIMNENPLIGVGPTSVNGEIVGDNAYVVLIHNGGLIALVTIVGYYMRHLFNSFRFRDTTTTLLILTTLIVSMGMPILTGGNLTLFIIYYLCIEKNISNRYGSIKMI